MSDSASEVHRRTVLKAGAGLAVASGLAGAQPVPATPKPESAIGRPGDFDFLAGNWKISHGRLKTARTKD